MVATPVEQKTYLELSNPATGVHRFYEVTTRGTQVTIRYGQIGYPGRSMTFHSPTDADADRYAQRMIRRRKRRGYVPAVLGAHPRVPLSRRTGTPTSHPVPNTLPALKKAPMLWKFSTGSAAFGISVNDELCWIGNEDGRIFGLNHKGEVLTQFTLPAGVKCLVADDDWVYAGCDDGNVYDLSGNIPRIAYQIAKNVDIYWMDIKDGALAVSDAGGRIARFNYENESEWLKETYYSRGWMVRSASDSLYHGHSAGVTAYTLDGQVIWDQTTSGDVLFGWQEEDTIYAGTSDNKVYSFAKNGEPGTVYDCDATIFSCAAAENGRYVFAGDWTAAIYCFAENGERLWKLDSGCGTPCSMQFFNGYLYIVTINGDLACIDVSEAAIKAVEDGEDRSDVPVAYAPAPIETPVATTLETTTDASRGVLLECIREAGRLRIRVANEDYNPHLRVQFPRNIREEGMRYVVDEIRLSQDASFYRAFGDIKRLVSE